MQKLMERAKHVLGGEEGASNIEIIVWISVVLGIATVLFIFRDSVINFLTKAVGVVDNLRVN